MITESASGKIILFGEHAVVYGRPALAVPLSNLRARVRIEKRTAPGTIIHALDLGRALSLDSAAADEPLAAIVRLTLEKLGVPASIGLELWIESDIPLASHLGSSAAVSTAIVRALAAYFDTSLKPQDIAALVYESEKIYHGTPSGIDNTVIAYEKPIRFTTTAGAQPFHIARPFNLAIANTGVSTPTKDTVGDVRRGWEREPARYEKIFDGIATLVRAAQAALANGELEKVAELMNSNQEFLRTLEVSSPELENLLRAARNSGALGGKLSGGGRGGNVIVCVKAGESEKIREALVKAGATSVIVTIIQAR